MNCTIRLDSAVLLREQIEFVGGLGGGLRYLYDQGGGGIGCHKKEASINVDLTNFQKPHYRSSMLSSKV